jgi:LmbE family N-acetylglucosaminyl deacetylase
VTSSTQSLSDDTVVVISPHPDDAVLSLGCALASWSCSGYVVEVLTAFAGDPKSDAAAGDWDRQAGFATAGEAARGRGEENEQACNVMGVRSRSLPFKDAQYAGTHDEQQVSAAVRDSVSGASAVLLPGFPLRHPDHLWLSRMLLAGGLPCPKVGLLAEQPYRYIVRRDRPRPAALPDLSPLIAGEPRWRTSTVRTARYLPSRWRAIHCYRSQLPLLGMVAKRETKLSLMLAHELTRGGEAIAWLS